MVKEFLTLHVGQAGVQSSHALWELVCIEHGIGSDGMLRDQSIRDNSFTGEHIEAMYYEIKNSRFVPRAILLDLEPTVVDEVRMGSYRDLWNPLNIINEKEDAASNYARGFYTSGKPFLIFIVDRINRELERCDNLSAFEVIHSFAGGTGAGLTALIYETLSEYYGKKFKFSLGVFPSPRLSEIMVESYNAVLHTSSTLPTQDCVVVFDNESLFKQSLQKLNVSQPTFSLMNRLVSQMFTSISLSHRYQFFGSQHADVTELLTNLVPYPRIHFPIMSYSPIMSFSQQSHEDFNCARLTSDVFHDDSHVMQCSMKDNKFMSCCMLYRGSVSPKPIIDALAKMKRCRDINFVDWCPTGFKIGINTCPPIQIPNSEQAIGDNALCMISGNTAVGSSWAGLLKKFDMLLSKRAFVHWYVAEGLEEGEFLDSRDNIKTLILDYEELNSQLLEEDTTEEQDLNTNVQMNINNTNTNNAKVIPRQSSKVEKLYQSNHNTSNHHGDFATSNESQSSKRNNTGKSDKRKFGYFNNQMDLLTAKESKPKKVTKKIDNKNNDTIIRSNTFNTDKNETEERMKKRIREKTKDLEVSTIAKTVEKYIVDKECSSSGPSPEIKPRNLSFSRNTLSKGSNANSTSYSFNSSKFELPDQNKPMKNNNKGQSISNSMSTNSGSRQKPVVGLMKTSKSILKILDPLINKSVDQNECNFNFMEICSDLGKEFQSMNTIESLIISNSSERNSPAIKRHLLMDMLPRDEKVLCLIEEQMKQIETLVNVKTDMSQNFKMTNLTFSNFEIVSCEPMVFSDHGCCSSVDTFVQL